jgi:hypothetical protein
LCLCRFESELRVPSSLQRFCAALGQRPFAQPRQLAARLVGQTLEVAQHGRGVTGITKAEGAQGSILCDTHMSRRREDAADAAASEEGKRAQQQCGRRSARANSHMLASAEHSVASCACVQRVSVCVCVCVCASDCKRPQPAETVYCSSRFRSERADWPT